MRRSASTRLLVLWAMAAVIVLGACGDDDDSTTDSGDDPADAVEDTAESPSGSPEDDGDDSGSGAGAPMGTATVDGTTYTLVADLQCLVAIDEANQISISGQVEENPSDDPVEFSYGWDSDDDVNDFSIDISDELEFSTFGGLAEFGEPEVDGQSVSASGTVQPMIGDPVEASFDIDCSG